MKVSTMPDKNWEEKKIVVPTKKKKTEKSSFFTRYQKFTIRQNIILVGIKMLY